MVTQGAEQAKRGIEQRRGAECTKADLNLPQKLGVGSHVSGCGFG
jgi:hypothetical protein